MLYLPRNHRRIVMTSQSDMRFNVVALGLGLSAALVVLFVLCLLAALVMPGWPASHAWIGLFSVAPMNSARVWLDGIVFGVVFGWVAALVLGLVYNRAIRR